MSTDVEGALDLPVAGGPIILSAVLEQGGQLTSRVAIRWCLGPEATAALQERNIKDLLLFVVVVGTTESGKLVESERFLIPLGRVEHWIWFQYARTNHILAEVVWASNTGDKTPGKVLMAQTSGGCYTAKVLEPDRANRQGWRS